MAGFDEYRIAAKARDVIRLIVNKEIRQLRPAPAYATVIAIDRAGRRCQVRFAEDDEDSYSSVGMGSIQPAAVGQVVRVAGVLGDRFIDDVMGTAYVEGVAAGYAIGDVRPWFTDTLPTGWVSMEGQSTSGMAAAIVSMYGANLPDLRDRTLLGASATKTIGVQGGSATVTLTTGNLPAHVHSGPSHTHSGPSHTHGQVVVADNGAGTGVRADFNADVTNGGAFAQGVATDSAGTGNTGGGGTGDTGSTGSGNGFSIIQPFHAVHWIVKVA